MDQDKLIHIRHTDGTESWYDENLNCVRTLYVDGRDVIRDISDKSLIDNILNIKPYNNPFAIPLA